MEKLSPENLLTFTKERSFKGSPFSVKSKRTGKDYTFKVSKTMFKGQLYTHVYVEQEYLKFKHIGVYQDGGVFKKGTEVLTPSSKAIAWLIKQVYNGNVERITQNVEVFHLGKCLCCGRALSDVDSIERGFGPICRKLK